MPDIHKSLAYMFSVLSIMEQSSQIGFGRGCVYVVHDRGNDVDRSIGGWRGRVGRRSAWVVGEEEVSSYSRSGKRIGEIRDATPHM